MLRINVFALLAVLGFSTAAQATPREDAERAYEATIQISNNVLSHLRRMDLEDGKLDYLLEIQSSLASGLSEAKESLSERTALCGTGSISDTSRSDILREIDDLERNLATAANSFYENTRLVNDAKELQEEGERILQLGVVALYVDNDYSAAMRHFAAAAALFERALARAETARVAFDDIFCEFSSIEFHLSALLQRIMALISCSIDYKILQFEENLYPLHTSPIYGI
jgi:hypothetical protein